jgi:hypothetical protein
MLCEVCGSVERDAVLIADSREVAFNVAQDCTECGYANAMQADWESLRQLSLEGMPRDVEAATRF